jgi:aspartate aminotransferase
VKTIDDLLPPAVRHLLPSPTLAINERCAALLARGRPVLRLGLGQSPFPVPEPVVAALREHAAEKDYLAVQGLLALREAVAEHHRRRLGIACDADEVLVGPGSKELIFLLQLVARPELLLPSPSWVSYEPQARLLGQQVHWLTTEAAAAWKLEPAVLDRFCRSRPLQHRLLVLSDEIYGETHHAGRHVSLARFYPEATLVSGGLSKWCGAGGWRLGTLLVPRALQPLRQALVAAASETYTAVSAPIQHAAVVAFTGGPALDAYLHDSRRVLGALGRHCAKRLRGAGVTVAWPEGGFYLFCDLEAWRQPLAARGVATGQALCEHLLDSAGVATLPGTCFGRGQAELTLRLAYVDFDGGAALAAVRELTGEPDGAFLRRHCGHVVEAVERIATLLHG